MELDHLFVFVPNEAVAQDMMDAAGLVVNYSRQHAGQGTRNLCACLDDIFLELLWLDGTEVAPEAARIGLYARGRGEGSPLGVAWRGPAPLPTEPYAAPFLPDGATIAVAAASLDQAIAKISGDDEVFIAGGASVYEAALPRVARIYYTAVEAEVEGDVFFPSVDLSDWRLIEDIALPADEKNEYPFRFLTYERMRAS